MALEELYPHWRTDRVAGLLGRPTHNVYQAAIKAGLRKTPEYLASPDACRLRRGGNIGASTRFTKGQIPRNKGVRMPGWAPGRMAETQFKKGAMSGAAQKNYQPVGTEVVDSDGYRKRKVSDTGKQVERWRFVHVLVWEKEHGPVPRGHAVIFKDGNRTNIALANLELISRAELMQRNTLHNLPKEVVEVIRLRGVLNRTIRRKERA